MSIRDTLYAAVRGARGDLSALAGKYAGGDLTPDEFGDRVAALLEDAHAYSVMLGRHLAGDDAPAEADDRKFGELVVDGEAEYLARFVKDLDGGRYRDEEGNEDEGAIGRRASLYASRMVGTGNEAFALTSDEGGWEWRLGGAELHCGECPDLAAGSPYETPPAYPGANSTPCLSNCLCSLVRSDGVEGFRLVRD